MSSPTYPHIDDNRNAVFKSSKSFLEKALLQKTKTSDWITRHDINGKPHVVDVNGKSGPEFSLSHTKDLIGGAFARQPVGFDIEYWRPRDFNALASYAFGPKERTEVAMGGMAAFYRIWTVREALSKLTGIGFLKLTDGYDYADGLSEGAFNCYENRVFYALLAESHSFALAAEKNAQLNNVDICIRSFSGYNRIR